ncbi:hypothetical protein CW751_02930 [Brumimicrobium salinarum]|uniref:HMA domain-containing protein n=1 Tax=Brumimicrobium salinarum TaxID=2058658 RepID=A0A2I0R6U2_9FLAO|nr:hypothetical protein [Brumimicrobium salinarum]PKR82302.1 hypothetical protein CW751_02930 [Brumimicrobium salinarum]
MNLKNFIITSFFIGASFVSFSQYTYSFEVSSFNNNSPKQVLSDFTQHIEESDQYIKEGVFYIDSKISYTEENFKEIASATGYTINRFKITTVRKDQDTEE